MMPSIRGRWAQFHVLSNHQRLVPYLVPTLRLTHASLITMLAQNDAIVLKPIVGMNFVKIYKINESITVLTNEMEYLLPKDDEVYSTIQKHLSNQNYVIQPTNSPLNFWKKTFHSLVTLHKKDTNWSISALTKRNKHYTEGSLYYNHFLKLEKIAKLAAEALHKAYPMCETIVLEMSINLFGEIYIHDSYLHFPISKWSQYQSINAFMPATELLTEQTLKFFLKAYETVFIKPCNGQQGKKIIKITRNRSNLYEIHSGRTKWTNESMTEVYHFLQKHLNLEEHYLIQQGIPLATIDNSVFDVRVVVQKVAGSWQISGKAVKVAGDGFFITNAAKSILPLRFAVNQSTISSSYHDQLDERINTLCVSAALELDKLQPRHEIGFDVGITNNGEIWIIEGNYRSDVSMFHLLEDRTMYKTILNNRNMMNQPIE